MDNKKPLIAHLSILTACVIWGLMSPVGKSAMAGGIDGLDLVSFRIAGGTILFWAASFFAKREHVPLKDCLLMLVAGLFALVFNQCCFTIGLSMTSPSNASIITTSTPIFALILAAIILKEPVTWKKACGVLIGCCGAVILILTSASAGNAKVGNIWGDILCIVAQLSFALYLTLFNKLIKRYSVFTINKWIFLWSAVLILPFSSQHVLATDWNSVPTAAWLEAGYVVFFGTFVAYLLTMVAQKVLRPTVVSTYNYVQPMVAVSVSLLTGMAVLKTSQCVAMVLVFCGVWLVIKSKSRNDILKAEQAKLEAEKAKQAAAETEKGHKQGRRPEYRIFFVS